MSDKKAPAVIKRDTAENWSKAKNFTPSLGTIVIYDFEDNSVGIKYADGKTLVGDLPFLNEVRKPIVKENNLVL